MKITVRAVKEFILRLNQDEISWLNTYLRTGPGDEPPYSRKMRGLFWELLTSTREGEANGETED